MRAPWRLPGVSLCSGLHALVVLLTHGHCGSIQWHKIVSTDSDRTLPSVTPSQRTSSPQPRRTSLRALWDLPGVSFCSSSSAFMRTVAASTVTTSLGWAI